MPVMADALPPYCAHISHRVLHPDRWKAAFDDLEGARRDASILGHLINRARDDPHLITVFLPLTDLDHARSSIAAYVRDEALRVLGIASPPNIQWLQPVREALIRDRQVPAVLLLARVLDYDGWLAGYDAARPVLRAAGIIGHSIERGLDDAASITLYHQAESFDVLHDLLAEPEICSVMLGGSVASDLQATFHTGGWAKTY
jgi:hypothetical protein